MPRFNDTKRIGRMCLNHLAVFILLAFCGSSSFAELDYHGIGWVNTFVPGGGRFLMGEPLKGSAQALAEIGAFGWGFSLSRRTPLTLDGVPEDIVRP